MTGYEIAALIGATAWLPQLGVLAYRLVSKPRLVLVPVEEIEVGYNFLGPIVNIRASLFAETRDSIVLDMRVTLTHERGRVVRLAWHSFVETFSELRSGGDKIEVSRDQIATALKLSTALPVEKFIRFQDPAFQREMRSLTASADQELSRLQASVAEPAKAFAMTDAHDQYVGFYRHNLPWEVGRYTMEIQVQLVGRRTPSLAVATFELNARDIERLQDNVAGIVTRTQQIAEGVPEAERVAVANWALPRLASKDIMVRK